MMSGLRSDDDDGKQGKERIPATWKSMDSSPGWEGGLSSLGLQRKLGGRLGRGEMPGAPATLEAIAKF